MQPEEIDVAAAPIPIEVLTSENGTVDVVSSPPEPVPVATSETDGGPVAAAMALVILIAGLGKKLEMILQARHKSRMEQAAREAALRAEEAQVEAQRAAQAVEDARIRAEAEAAKAENGGPGEAGDNSDEATVCACEENQKAIDDLTRRLKALEAWRKKKKLI